MRKSQTHPFADHIVKHIYICAMLMAYKGKKNQFETSFEYSHHMKLHPPIHSNLFFPLSNQYVDSCKVTNFQWRRSHAQRPVNSPFSFFSNKFFFSYSFVHFLNLHLLIKSFVRLHHHFCSVNHTCNIIKNFK